MSKVPGFRVCNGASGKMWWDGLLVSEVKSANAKVVANREPITMVGKMGENSKLTGTKGEGSFVLHKVYSRGTKAMLDAWKAGRDVRAMLTLQSADPDTKDGGRESVTIGDTWFNELMLMDFEAGKPQERTYDFGFDPDSVIINDEIPVTEG